MEFEISYPILGHDVEASVQRITPSLIECPSSLLLMFLNPPSKHILMWKTSGRSVSWLTFACLRSCVQCRWVSQYRVKALMWVESLWYSWEIRRFY